MLLYKMNPFRYSFYEDVGRGDACVERLNILKKLTYFEYDLSKLLLKTYLFNVSFQPARSKYICPKVENFEQKYFRLLPEAYS